MTPVSVLALLAIVSNALKTMLIDRIIFLTGNLPLAFLLMIQKVLHQP